MIRRYGSVPVRNAATIGGNIANGSPIGDSPPPLIALNARLHLAKGRCAPRDRTGRFLSSTMASRTGRRANSSRQSASRASPTTAGLQDFQTLRSGYLGGLRALLSAPVTASSKRPALPSAAWPASRSGAVGGARADRPALDREHRADSHEKNGRRLHAAYGYARLGDLPSEPAPKTCCCAISTRCRQGRGRAGGIAMSVTNPCPTTPRRSMSPVRALCRRHPDAREHAASGVWDSAIARGKITAMDLDAVAQARV